MIETIYGRRTPKPAAMREGVFFIREQGHGSPRAPSRIRAFLGRHRTVWLIAAASAVLLAGVGAFGTDHAPPVTLYSYWLGMMFASAFVYVILRERLESQPGLSAKPLALAVTLILSMAAAMTPIVWIVAGFVLGGSLRPAKMLTLFPQAILITTAFVTLEWAIGRRWPVPGSETPEKRPLLLPVLLKRLPKTLSGAELLAIQAEDHYLRLHTDRGSTIILMRMSDAMRELEGLEGAQTHRSWWVAREAVVNATRGRGRARLELKGGLTVPVSRTYAPKLRAAGWF